MDEQFKDTPKAKQAKQDHTVLQWIAKGASFLHSIGIKTDLTAKILAKTGKLQEFGEAIDLPDRFNELLGAVGWMAFDSLNVDTMRGAIQLAETQGVAAAEAFLVKEMSATNTRWRLEGLSSVDSFRIRYHLITAAFEDYACERYHACVPVFLLIIDGVVADMVNSSFAYENPDLSGWDSLTGVRTGLPQLHKIFTTQRGRTTTEPIEIPYRHGILHGRDLNYANPLVAAKCWGALLALKDWARARHTEASRKAAYEARKRPTSLLRTIQKAAKVKQQREKLDQFMAEWRPRSRTAPDDFDGRAEVDSLPAESPERTATLYLRAWVERKYGSMAQLLSGVASAAVNKTAGDLRRKLEGRPVEDFELLHINDEVPARTIISVRIYVPSPVTIELRLIYVDAAGDPTFRGAAGGGWKVLYAPDCF